MNNYHWFEFFDLVNVNFWIKFIVLKMALITPGYPERNYLMLLGALALLDELGVDVWENTT